MVAALILDLYQLLLYCVQVIVEPKTGMEPHTEFFGTPLETCQYIFFGCLDLSRHLASAPTEFNPVLGVLQPQIGLY